MSDNELNQPSGSARNWRRHPKRWVIGCIDAYGAITAAAVERGRTHNEDESRGKRWRWNICRQEMAWEIPGRTIEEINNPEINELTEDEFFIVWDWLAKRGYTDEKTMPNGKGQS